MKRSVFSPLPGRLIKRGLPLLAACSLLVFTSACAPAEEPVEEERDDQGVLVEAVRLNATDFIEFIELIGVTEPVRAATLAPEVAGRIVRYNLEAGATVEEGDLLMQVDTSQQGAQSAQIQAQIDQLDRDIERTRRLLDRGLATQAELDQLQSQRDANYQSLRSVRIGVGNARLRAPFAGTIVSESAEIGEYANPGQSVGRLADISAIKVMVNVPEREISAVREGATAFVDIPSLNRTVAGEVQRVSIEADPRNRTFEVEVLIPNEEGVVRGGMRATVRIRKNDLRDIVVAPLDALLQGVEGTELVLARDGQAEIVRVTTGPTRGRFVVIEEGAAPGDMLVVRGQRDLVAGERIQAVDTGECCDEQLRSYLPDAEEAQAMTATEGETPQGSEADAAEQEGTDAP